LARPFSAWRTGAPYYLPLLVVGVVLLFFLPYPWFWYVAVPLLGLGIFVLFFFRDPMRRIPAESDAVVSPADGAVTAVELLEETPFYDGPCKRISIFLSVFNVHVNRAPAAGSILAAEYKVGAFHNAMRADTSTLNESNTIYMDTDLGPMTVRQITGAVARRIVFICEVGDRVDKGAKIGMIKFGSRTELYLPVAAEVTVKLKDKVRGGATVVARLQGGDDGG
jgi:phosphatidylserine decarboxylase